MFYSLTAMTLAVAQATAPDPLTEAALQALQARLAEAKAELAALPEPQSDSERLARMGQLDQSTRRAFTQVMGTVAPPERGRVRRALWPEVRAIDLEHQKQLLEMVPQDGWFYKSRYGQEAAASAFLIVQHGDETLWERFLPILAELVPSGEVAGAEYAMMFDRLQMSKDLPQRFGTQMTCPIGSGQWSLWRLEDEARVDEWRTEVGLGPIAEFVDSFKTGAPPTC